MDNKNCMDLSTLTVEHAPFPHCYGIEVLQNGVGDLVYDWFILTDAWSITKADFYEQYEFSLFDTELPEELQGLVSEATITTLQNKLKDVFQLTKLQLVGITAHKLVDGQRIAIHNDFIEGEETHRFVIHFNPSWTAANGGFFMVFDSANVEDVSKLILPIHNSAIGFEISRKSHHAVSEIHGITRYSIVYTFKAG